MTKSKKIVFGILLLIAALGFLIYAIFPTWAIFTIAIWKWLLIAVLLYWAIDFIFLSKKLSTKLSSIFPFALIFILIENDIAALCGLKKDFANRWIVIVGALLFVIAVQLIFNREKVVYVNKNTQTDGETVSSTYTEGKSYSMGENKCYLDADRDLEACVSSNMGQLDVYYQNTDVGDTTRPLKLKVSNSLGETVIHVPESWNVICNPSNTLGEINVRPNEGETTRDITIEATNRLGEISIISD